MTSILYKFFYILKKVKIKILWNSQKCQFKHIGKKSYVSSLPIVEGYSHISIGDYFSCGESVRIEAWKSFAGIKYDPQIIIGNNVTFTDRCYISCVDEIKIDDGVLLGRDVFITDNSHGEGLLDEEIPVRRRLSSKGKVNIGKNVWIGRQTTILSGVSIGDNSIIGAHSLVNKDIPSNCIVGGIPAKIIKKIPKF